MGRKLVPSPEGRFNREAFEIFDDFDQYIVASTAPGTRWIDIQIDVGCSVASAEDSTLLITCGGTDNFSATLSTVKEQLQFLANKAMFIEGRMLFADTASTNSTAMFFGAMDAIQLDRVADAGQSVVINDSGAVIWKKAEGENWIFETNVAGGTQVQSISTAVPQSTSHQVLAIDVVPRSSTIMEIRPFVDGVQLVDSTTGEPIMHATAVASSVAMDLGIEAKAGHADGGSVAVDYIYASQIRA